LAFGDTVDPEAIFVGSGVDIVARVNNTGISDTVGDVVLSITVPDGLRPRTVTIFDSILNILDYILALLTGNPPPNTIPEQLSLSVDANSNAIVEYNIGVISGSSTQEFVLPMTLDTNLAGEYVISAQLDVEQAIIAPLSITEPQTQMLTEPVAETTQEALIEPLDAPAPQALSATDILLPMAQSIRLLSVPDTNLTVLVQAVLPPPPGQCASGVNGLNVRATPQDSNNIILTHTGTLYLSGIYDPDNIPNSGDEWYLVAGYMEPEAIVPLSGWVSASPYGDDSPCNSGFGSLNDLPIVDEQGIPIAPTPTPTPSPTPSPEEERDRIIDLIGTQCVLGAGVTIDLNADIVLQVVNNAEGGLGNNGLPPINCNLTFNGNGHIIDGNGALRIFYVANRASLTLNNVTLQNGTAVSGGAIFADRSSAITITQSVFQGNIADTGAALYMLGDGSQVDISNSLFEGNDGSGNGTVSLQNTAVGQPAIGLRLDNICFLGNLPENQNNTVTTISESLVERVGSGFNRVGFGPGQTPFQSGEPFTEEITRENCLSGVRNQIVLYFGGSGYLGTSTDYRRNNTADQFATQQGVAWSNRADFIAANHVNNADSKLAQSQLPFNDPEIMAQISDPSADLILIGYSAGGEAAVLFAESYRTNSDMNGTIAGMVLLGPTMTYTDAGGVQRAMTNWKTWFADLQTTYGTSIMVVDDNIVLDPGVDDDNPNVVPLWDATDRRDPSQYWNTYIAPEGERWCLLSVPTLKHLGSPFEAGPPFVPSVDGIGTNRGANTDNDLVEYAFSWLENENVACGGYTHP
jgi:pimeloyl-ACP methyl ester carboxylesterase